MNTEDSEFERIEAEAKRRAARDDNDDTQDYVRGHYTAEQMLAWGKANAEAEREACVKVVDAAKAGKEDWDSNDWNQAVEFCASRIRARGTT